MQNFIVNVVQYCKPIEINAKNNNLVKHKKYFKENNVKKDKCIRSFCGSWGF